MGAAAVKEIQLPLDVTSKAWRERRANTLHSGVATLEGSLVVTNKVNIKLLGIYPKDLKTCPHKNTDVYKALFMPKHGSNHVF